MGSFSAYKICASRPVREAAPTSDSTRGGTYLTVGERLARMLERGCDLRDEDVARLSPFVRSHVNTQGRYSFARPGLGGRLRPLNDPEDETDGL